MSFSKLTKVPLSSWTKRVSTVSMLPSGSNTAQGPSYLRSFTSSTVLQEQQAQTGQDFNNRPQRNNYNNNNNRRHHNRNNNHNNNRHSNNNNRIRSGNNTNRSWKPDLPEDHIRNAFNEDLMEFREKLTLSNQRTARGSASLVDTQAAMNIYTKLKETPGVLAKSDIGALIQGLHTSARVSVKSMSRVISAKRKEAIMQQSDILANYLEIVGNDLLSGRVVTNEFGFMQFFTAYATLNRPNRGLELYERFCKAAESVVEAESDGTVAKQEAVNTDMADLIKNSGKVTGAVFHLLISAGAPFERIENLYEETREHGIGDLNIEHNMIRAFILYDRVTEALKLYSNVLKVYLEDERADYYFGRIHEFFVGDCSDVNVATNFYYEAVENKVPYSVECHPSAVHRLMELAWREHKDLDELINIWAAYLSSVRTYREPNYNVLSYSLFVHFFEAHPVVTNEAYEKLKQIISSYNERQGRMSAIFLNSLLAVAGGKWRDSEVILGIVDSFDMYGLPKKVDSLRIILNSLRGVETEPEIIRSFWNERLALVEENPLEKYDFWALGKACNRTPERIALFVEVWSQYIQENQPTDASLQEILGFFRIPSNETINIAEALESPK
ncbi:hypothetical protein AWJ20_1365 [Sugiyamaella lignohabitans]|uniref:Protein RMD9, mitochondrial n=1 Tax=Sugiyamaella lignohabitans TaxID=796027 RepID=A0A167DMY1_9ASCO|nr:uncharacterized protein AWJ20_1365 [Sugiyamaella lignohabitans]ANB13086.1 hypothetical protein AWJ20_1365 [Sugiyamaella lignohabitans]